MSSIPDTGPGFSGFLGYQLWFIYAYFPSQGRWDWVLLFLTLGILVHFAFLPYLWNSIQVYRRRNLWNLYAGGGVFMIIREGKVRLEPSLGTLSGEMGFFWLIHLLFPIWSVAALVLLHAFLVSAVLADGCRMLFVYIQHKQAFG